MSGDISDDDMMMMDEHDHDHNEFGDGKAANSGAGETLIAKHLRDKANKMNQRYGKGPKQSGRTLKEKFMHKASWPLRHLKKNWLKAAATTVGGGAAAFGVAYLANGAATPDSLAPVFKTAALSYPIYASLEYLGGFIGYSYGHMQNWRNNDRFQEVRSEPKGRGAGIATAAALIAFGGIFGNGYMETAKDVTIGLPQTVFVDTPDAVIDHLTDWENTQLDWKWELEDQASCLYREQAGLQPEMPVVGQLECKDKPEAAGMRVVMPTPAPAPAA